MKETSSLGTRCSLSDSNLITANPLLYSKLIENVSAISVRTQASIKASGNLSFSSKSHHSSRQTKCSIAGLNRRYVATANIDYLRGTYSTPWQQQALSYISNPLTEQVSQFEVMGASTDKQIQEFIAQKLASYKALSKATSTSDCPFSEALEKNNLQFGSTIPERNNYPIPAHSDQQDKINPNLICASKKCWGTAAREEEISSAGKDKIRLTPTFKETPDCAVTTSERHSTEYHQIAATSTNNEGKSRLIPAAVSKMCLDEESEEHRGSRHSCSSSQGYKSLELDVHQNPKDIKPMTVNNSAFEQKKKRKEDACLKSMEALGLENVSDFIVSEDISLKLTSVISVKESELSQKSQFEYAPWVNNLKDPQYEDISDDEHFRPPNEYIQYEDISDNENAEFEKMTVEGSSQLSVLNKCSLFGNENDEHVDFFPKTSPEKERLDFQQHCSGRNFAETGDSVENLLKNERRLDCLTSHSVSCSPHSFVEEDESDDESQDDWIVIPICMSGLEFEEEEEENEDGLETFVQDNCGGQQNQTDWDRSVRDCKTNFPASHPSSQLKEYETVESWLEAMGGQSLNNFEDKPSWPTPEHEDSEDVPQGMSDSHIMSDSSCETEDSCDYSSGSECNYMTASRQALEKRPTQEPPEAGDCASENGNDEDEVANVQKSQGNSSSESLNDLMAAKKHSEDQRNGQQIFNDIITIKSDSEDESDENDEGLKNAASPEMSVSSLGNLGEPECVQQKTPNHSTDIIVIEDSDTEEESDQSYQKSNRKRLFSSVSVKGDSYPLLSPETIQREDGTAQTSFTSADLPRSQHQLTLQNAAEEMLHGACSDSSHEKITGTQLMESKGGPNHVQHKISRPRKNTKGILSSSPSDNGDNSTVVSKKSTRNEETESKKRRVSFANSAKLQEAATHAAKFSAGDKKNTGASEKNKLGLSGNIKERHWSKPKLANDGSRFSKPSIHGNVQQQGMRSRPLSSPGKEVHLSTTVGRSASNSREKFGAERGSFHARGLCQSGEATAAANLNGPTHGPFPRQPSSSFRPPFHHSFSSPSKLGHLLPSQKGSSSSSSSSSATVKNPSKMKVLKDWQSTHHPIRTERKYNRKGGKDLETINHTPNSDSGGAFKSLPDQRDKTPRQRHRSHDSKTLLLKRSRNEAVEWSKAINRNSQQTQRSSVGVGYKWSDKPPVARSAKGFGT